jgi:hypothetical protein
MDKGGKDGEAPGRQAAGLVPRFWPLGHLTFILLLHNTKMLLIM